MRRLGSDVPESQPASQQQGLSGGGEWIGAAEGLPSKGAKICDL